MTRVGHTYDVLNRPCRIPTDMEARIALSRDLSRGWRGVDVDKARGLNPLPLFEVALDGREGFVAMVMWAAQRKAA